MNRAPQSEPGGPLRPPSPTTCAVGKGNVCPHRKCQNGGLPGPPPLRARGAPDLCEICEHLRVAMPGQALGSAWKTKAVFGVSSTACALQFPGSLVPPRPLWVPPTSFGFSAASSDPHPRHCPPNFLFSQEAGRQGAHALHPNPMAWPLDPAGRAWGGGRAGGDPAAEGP